MNRQGVKDVSELKEVYKDKIDDLKRKASVPGANAPLDAQETRSAPSQQSSPWPKPPPPPMPQAAPSESPVASNKSPPGVKTLSSFLDVQKTMDLPQREIEALWKLRHINSPHALCATMPASLFRNIARTAKRHPQFVLPGLPAEQKGDQAKDDAQPGSVIHFMQWTFPSPQTATVLFTHLAEFKLRGEHAQPHTTLTHHLELAEPNGIVLCQGNVLPDRGVSMDEGKWLLLQLQKFYNIGEEVEADESSQIGKDLKRGRRKLVEMFSRGASDFKIEDLVAEAERMG